MILRRVLCAALLSSSVVLSQGNVNATHDQAPDEHVLPIQISNSNLSANSDYSDFRVNLFPRLATEGNTQGPLAEGSKAFFSNRGEPSSEGLGTRLPESPRLIPGVPAPGFYPGDVAYHGGAVLKSVESHNLYLNQPASHWGQPGRFLSDLGQSKFIHTIDQYVDEAGNSRYTLGGGGTIPYPISNPLGDNDLLRIIHAAAALFGSGYGHIYHVFLPKGVDFCEPGGICYSPDNPPTFFFCAFHGSVQFKDIGHVVFSLEPYGNVRGCSTEMPTPNGVLQDSVDSILSHELFEAISDPDGDGWWAQNSNGTFFQEIGDLCAGVDPQTFYFKNPISRINGREYEIQLEYSNTYHACANVP